MRAKSVPKPSARLSASSVWAAIEAPWAILGLPGALLGIPGTPHGPPWGPFWASCTYSSTLAE